MNIHRSRWLRALGVLTVVAVLSGSLGLAGGAQAGTGGRAAQLADCPELNEMPTLLGPEGLIHNRRPVFRWTPVDGIDEYAIAILYAGPDGDYVLGTAFTAHGTSFVPPAPLPFYEPMRWKVKTECNEDYGPFTESMYFEIEPRCLPHNC